jgi:dipeptidyl aminopeptidase/acylaminoacyl peptidase
MRLLTAPKFRRPSLKHIVFGGVGGTLGVLSLLCGAAIYLVETLTRPKKLAPFADYTFTPFELDLPAENVEFSPRKGKHKVSGWFIPRPGATTTLLVCPGYRSSKSDMLGIATFLWKAGHSVLAFEYYGHGTQVGTHVTLGYREMEDFMGAVDYVQQRAPGTRIGVVGYSMGAAIAIMCAARTPEVEAIVADSAFATHSSVVDYNVRRALHMPSAPFAWLADYLLGWRAGYHFRQVEPLRDIALITPRPILLIHGGKDTVVDPHDAPLLYAAAQEPKELWIVPGADHCGAYFADRPLYVKNILAFFEEHLKQEPVRSHLVEVDSPERVQAADREAFEAAAAFLADQEELPTPLSEAS